MLDQEDELHLLGFLATLAGLLGIVVGVSQFQVGSASSSTVRAYFSLLLVVFLFAAALAYLGALQDRDVASFNLAVLGYFSALLGFAVGLAAASLLPVDVQFGGFWVIAIVAALSFNWTLQRWHRKLDWGPGSRWAALGWVGSLDRGLGFSIGDTLTDCGVSF